LISNHRICCLSEATFESEHETFYSDHNIQEKRNFISLNRLFNKVTLFRFIANLLCNPLPHAIQIFRRCSHVRSPSPPQRLVSPISSIAYLSCLKQSTCPASTTGRNFQRAHPSATIANQHITNLAPTAHSHYTFPTSITSSNGAPTTIGSFILTKVPLPRVVPHIVHDVLPTQVPFPKVKPCTAPRVVPPPRVAPIPRVAVSAVPPPRVAPSVAPSPRVDQSTVPPLRVPPRVASSLRVAPTVAPPPRMVAPTFPEIVSPVLMPPPGRVPQSLGTPPSLVG
jgi:hypothetical protein